MKLYTARTYQRGDNSVYPYPVEVNTPEDLRAAVAWDHVAAEYQQGHRGTERFISADCLMMDVDNATGKGQPDIPPEQWRDLDAIRADLPGVSFYAVTSRSHMKAKDGRPPRPKYHLYFEIPLTTSATEYRQIKLDLTERLPYFDANATDAARMFFGNTEAQVTYCPGDRLITDWIHATPAPERPQAAPAVELNPRTAPQRTGVDNGLYDMQQVLDAIPCSAVDREAWVKVGMALHQLGYDVSTWDAWSAHDTARYKPGECARKWRGFKRQGVGGTYLISLAKEYGWTPPERKKKEVKQMERTERINDATVHTVPMVQPVHEAQQEEAEAEPKETEQAPVSYVDLILQDFLSRRYEPIPTGIKEVDDIINGGFILETVVSLSAGPGMGKTLIAQQIFEEVAKQGRADILYFNLEMSRAQLIARSLSRATGYSTNTVMRGYEWTPAQAAKITRAAVEYKETTAPHMVYQGIEGDKTYQAILQRMEEAEAKRKNKDLPFITVIDYLQLLVSAEQREDEVQAIKRAMPAFKDFATKHRAIVVIISAQSRAVNESGKITQAAARDTSAVEYGVDVQLSLNYAAIASGDCVNIDDMRRKLKEGKLKKSTWNEICLVVTKHRFGQDRGICGMKREGKRSRFVFLPKQAQAQEDEEDERDATPEQTKRRKLY